MVHITVMSWAQTVAARHLSSCWRLSFASALRVSLHKSTELLRHKTPDFTPDMAILPTDQTSVL